MITLLVELILKKPWIRTRGEDAMKFEGSNHNHSNFFYITPLIISILHSFLPFLSFSPPFLLFLLLCLYISIYIFFLSTHSLIRSSMGGCSKEGSLESHKNGGASLVCSPFPPHRPGVPTKIQLRPRKGRASEKSLGCFVIRVILSLSIYLSISLSLSISIYLYLYLTIYLHPSIHPSIISTSSSFLPFLIHTLFFSSLLFSSLLLSPSSSSPPPLLLLFSSSLTCLNSSSINFHHSIVFAKSFTPSA